MAQTMASSSCIFTATTTTSPSLFKPSSLRLSTSLTAPFVSSEFFGHKLRPLSLPTSSRPIRDVVTMVRGRHRSPPPDLASYIFDQRIIYLGMCLFPSVTQLILSEFLWLQLVDEEKPIYFYINSTGTTKGDEKFGYETGAFAIYDAMSLVKPPTYTLCVGNAWGEAALLLAAGAKGHRASLRSSTIMMKQPIDRFQGQATDVQLARKEITRIKADLVKLLSRHIGKTPEEIEADIRRPKYFSPSEAVEYGIIDKVIDTERNPGGREVFADVKKA